MFIEVTNLLIIVNKDIIMSRFPISHFLHLSLPSQPTVRLTESSIAAHHDTPYFQESCERSTNRIRSLFVVAYWVPPIKLLAYSRFLVRCQRPKCWLTIGWKTQSELAPSQETNTPIVLKSAVYHAVSKVTL